ncbi:Cat eye syndrome critical region protein-like protein [Lachnellula occidentalis]|uniref:Cat eye syndrome critical region protein-like protein n=1 Tax=Lachnellula occidentalis TaxID=215460 RepID=A0A8H8SAG9_9HELO|nr:Cat eye syndrome critical region protein-like protein [Lachnellula occidentalis]
MVSSRKRGRQEMEDVEPPKEQSMLGRIRNTWEFANLAQYIFTFGRAVKIDENLDIEDLEMECLKPNSTILPEIGLALLKFVSSHRGLTPEIFDEYTRRQYLAKAPLRNPFGEDEDPANFNGFDTFTKIRVLQQLTQWTMGNPDRIREKMEEQKDSEQTIWRIEPFGWDSDDRTYIVLDDNRLYRRTDPPPPPPPAAKPRKNSKKAKAAARASKRRRVSEVIESEAEPADEVDEDQIAENKIEDDGLGGMTWECIAVTLDDFNAFLSSIEKSKDPNERILRKRIVDDLLPLLEKQEEARKRKETQKERELLNLEKLASAKRSSRIAGKMEQQKQDEEARETDRKRQAELTMAKKEQEKWTKLEKERESRMMTREQRLKEREARRILHAEELANLSEDSKKFDSAAGRLSERHLKAEIERKKQALEELAEEEDWIFDCICGAYGQIDDGTHSIACDECNIWQHSKCVGVSQAEADREDFHFICTTCRRRAEDKERAKTQPPIKIKLNRPGSSSSPLTPRQGSTPAVVVPSLVDGGTKSHPDYDQSTAQTTPKPQLRLTQKGTPQMATWQPGHLPSLQSPHHTSPKSSTTAKNNHANGHQAPPHRASQSPTLSKASPVQGASSAAYPSYANNGSVAPPQYSASRPSSAHAFSSPQPNSPMNLPPPPLAYNFVNGNSTSHRNGLQTQQSSSTHYLQGSPSINPYGAPTPSNGAGGQLPEFSDNSRRRRSMNLSSPLAGAPVLTPTAKINPSSSFPASSSPVLNNGPSMHTWQPPKSSPPHGVPPSPAQALPGQQYVNPGHSSPLPPAVTGLSPTKHSPPRSTSNGSIGSTTPSMLPPVASLSPSHQMQNLTPPVKSSEPDRAKPNGQAIAP